MPCDGHSTHAASQINTPPAFHHITNINIAIPSAHQNIKRFLLSPSHDKQAGAGAAVSSATNSDDGDDGELFSVTLDIYYPVILGPHRTLDGEVSATQHWLLLTEALSPPHQKA